MDGLKQCEKGHFFEDNLDSCPHCPKGTAKADEKKTQIQGGQPKNDPTKTEIFGGGVNQEGETEVKRNDSNKKEPSFDPLKTTISSPTPTSDNGETAKVSRRKLKGWIVTYDIADYGVDFKIVEGRNSIGQKASNDITVDDTEVSGMHAVLLCKNDKFMISDEMSTNGTFVNGEELQPRAPFNLNDGDKIKVGHTEFLFKTSF